MRSIVKFSFVMRSYAKFRDVKYRFFSFGFRKQQKKVNIFCGMVWWCGVWCGLVVWSVVWFGGAQHRNVMFCIEFF